MALGITTKEFAQQLGLETITIRQRMYETGSRDYFGVKPEKLPNGRLVWPANAAEMIKAQLKG